MIINITPNSLEHAVSVVCKQIKQKKLSIDWRATEENILWRELVACILGSQVKYEHASAVVNYLDSHGLLDIEKLYRDSILFEYRIMKALDQPIFPPITKLGGRRYRYPKLKANHIRRTGEATYLKGNTIKKILCSSKDERYARQKIISITVGIGPKQASLFLRNTGYANNLAILDKHILKYMSFIGLLPELVQVVTSLRKYENIENILRSYSEKFKEHLAFLDTAIWVVTRTCLRRNVI